MSWVSNWFRINRWWLLALPFAAVVVVGGSSERVKDQWYDTQLRHAVVTAQPGQFVTTTQHYEDLDGETTRTYSVRLSGFSTTTRIPPTGFADEGQKPPPGAQALVAHLDWRADPSQVLLDCHVTLIDDEGRRYDLPGTNELQGTSECVPAGRRGPSDPAKGQPRGHVKQGYERPTAWSTSPTFLVPDGIHVAEVRVWWKMPDYVALLAS